MSENEKKQDIGAKNRFTWKHFWSVMRYAYKYTDTELNSHSYPFLLAMYEEYNNRACENLGIPSDATEKETKKIKEYPEAYWGDSKTVSQKEMKVLEQDFDMF